VTRAAAIAGFALVAACAHVESPQLTPVVDDGALALRRCMMTEAFGRGDASIVGTAIVRCRAGREASCRALWWALDRL
jgi:hypothetical protein